MLALLERVATEDAGGPGTPAPIEALDRLRRVLDQRHVARRAKLLDLRQVM